MACAFLVSIPACRQTGSSFTFQSLRKSDAYPVTLEQLGTLLAQYKAGNPNLPVVIKGDAAVPFEKVREVLSAVKKLDIAQVGLVTKRSP